MPPHSTRLSAALLRHSQDEAAGRADAADRPRVVPRGPYLEVVRPDQGAFGAVRRDLGEAVVQRHVERHGDADRTDEGEQGAGQAASPTDLIPAEPRPS